jgi:hypothetical protein
MVVEAQSTLGDDLQQQRSPLASRRGRLGLLCVHALVGEAHGER